MNKIKELIKRALYQIRKDGWKDFVKKFFFYYLGSGKMLWASSVEDWKKKKSMAESYYAQYKNIPPREKLKIVYVIPNTKKIAGGVLVVLNQAVRLKKRGYDVCLLSQDFGDKIEWFSKDIEIVPIHKIKNILKEGIDILIATGWNTVPTVDLLPARCKAYFVQLDERRFYADFKRKEFVSETYKVDFAFLTMAGWMQKWLKEEFGKDAKYIPNGLDLEIFQEKNPLEKKKERIRVLLEGPIDVPFKGVAEAYDSVKDLDCDIWIVSSFGKPQSNWRYAKFFEKVAPEQMARIYSSCDILLKMSTVESFSYPPLEMMACGGVPVIKKVSGIEEYAINGHNSLIVENSAEAKEAVKKLIEDSNLREKLSQNGKETVQKWSWENSIDELEKFIKIIEK